MECRVHIKVHHHYLRRLHHHHHQQTENKTPPTTPFPFQNEAPPTPSSTRTETEAEAEAPPVVFQRPSFTGNSDSKITNKLAMILGAIIQFSLVLAVLSKKL